MTTKWNDMCPVCQGLLLWSEGVPLKACKSDSFNDDDDDDIDI